jgi:S1-C subfamily serine protease
VTAQKAIATFLFAAGLSVAPISAARAFAAETAEISPPLNSQAVDANSIQPQGESPAVPYQLDQNSNQPDPQGLKNYLDENEQISVFGIDLRLDSRKVERDIPGLLVVDVAAGSPGAVAGLHPFRQPARDVLNGVGMLAAMAFPPAMAVVPIVEAVPLHEKYDLIIGVDGVRIASFLGFYEQVRNVRPGEVVYLNVLRNGQRVQVPMRVTSAPPPPQTWVR